MFHYPCALGNLLVVCQSKLFHSSVGVVWDVGTKCFFVFHVDSREDIYVEGSPMVNHIENNLKQRMMLMKVKLKQFNCKRLIVFIRLFCSR
jgi:hypothetical protein